MVGATGAFGRVKDFLGKHVVAAVSVALAAVTCVLVPPDGQYSTYIEWGTLERLAAVLVTVCALRRTGAFESIAARLVGACTTTRSLVCVLVGVTAVASMFVTNDMALLALLPLAASALCQAGRRDLLPATFVLQGIAANLCGMVLPFGNPQNIYLTDCYSIGLADFVGTMAQPFAVSVVLLAVACLAFSGNDGVHAVAEAPEVPAGKAAVLVAVMVLCVLAVLGVVPAWIACVVALGTVAVVDRGAVSATDWGLILTFAAFFVLSGNLARIPAVYSVFAAWSEQGALLPGALLSQVISNVPAAVVLSRFTADWSGLLIGVNIGGAGTPIASLATIIVITEYGNVRQAEVHQAEGKGRFAPLLVVLNMAFLAALLGAGAVLGW